MKLSEIKKENLVATLNHPQFRGMANEIISKRIGAVLGGSLSPSKHGEAVRVAKLEADNVEAIANGIIAHISDRRNGVADREATREEVTVLCRRAIEAAVNRGLKKN